MRAGNHRFRLVRAGTSDQQGCEEGNNEGRNWLALVRCNESMNGESGGTGDNDNPLKALSGRAT